MHESKWEGVSKTLNWCKLNGKNVYEIIVDKICDHIIGYDI